MKEYAKSFYSSKTWQRCRDGYKKSVGGLCERCLKQGRYTPGVIVHHKVHISPENIDDPNVTLDWRNLELVCRDCHAVEHGAAEHRYEADALGRITAR